MIMLYFSGTGNSKYIAELFCRYMDAECHSIEEDIDFGRLISSHEIIAFCYPVYFSRVPRIMRDFVAKHNELLKNKKVIIFCTQMLFFGRWCKGFCRYVSERSYRCDIRRAFYYAEQCIELSLAAENHADSK